MKTNTVVITRNLVKRLDNAMPSRLTELLMKWREIKDSIDILSVNYQRIMSQTV
jgi:hypothetical protein